MWTKRLAYVMAGRKAREGGHDDMLYSLKLLSQGPFLPTSLHSPMNGSWTD